MNYPKTGSPFKAGDDKELFSLELSSTLLHSYFTYKLYVYLLTPKLIGALYVWTS